MLRPLTPRRLIHFSLYSSSSSTTASPRVFGISHLSSSSNYSHAPSFSRRQEEESRNVRVSVWWDFENCHLPIGVNVLKVAPMITAALRANGIKGPIQITAFGDVLQLSRANQEALSSTGINLNHIPNGGKNSADRSLLVDLMYWVSQNPPPAHLFLVSSDRDFAGVLHRLRMNNYNILLASLDSAPDVLCSAASIMWHWNSLVRGENLIGKHFNYPPDGSYGSWYGHFKAPIEDPFSTFRQPTSSKTEEVPESVSDYRFRPVPKSILKQIQRILKSQPQGISINDLRSELAKFDGNLDKDYYGHRKFSRFLLSVPDILQIQIGLDGQHVVRSVNHKSPEPFEPDTIPSKTSGTNKKAVDSIASTKVGTESTDTNYDADGKSDSGRQIKEPPNKTQQGISHGKCLTEATDRKAFQSQIRHQATVADLPQRVELKYSANEKVVERPIAEETVSLSPTAQQNVLTVENQISKTEVGFLKRMWRKLFHNDHFVEAKVCKSLEKYSSSGSQNATDKILDDRPEKRRAEDIHVISTRDRIDQVSQITHSSNIGDPEPKLKSSEAIKSYKDISGDHQGIYYRVINWWRSGRRGKVVEDLSGQDKNEMNLTSNQFEKPELFADSSFWNDVEDFLGTIKGSDIVSQSKTREEMAQNLRKEGPLALKSLRDNDLLHLVDLLISEKKWIEEQPSQSSPLRFTKPIENSTYSSHSHESNGLRSLFRSQTPGSNLKKSSEGDGEKKHGGVSHSGLFPSDAGRKQSGRSRADILLDCQKLLKELLKENPGGFNMGSFRKVFLERYNYPLDLQKLGYQKLASLMQIMPGVRVESNYIFPCPSLETVVPNYENADSDHATASSDNEVSESEKKDDSSDSQWEELGPISNTSSSSSRIEEESNCRGDAIGLLGTSREPNYEPALSEDDSSDSDAEDTGSTRSEGQRKSKSSSEAFSLLQVLESWHNQKEGDNSRTQSSRADSTHDLLSALWKGQSDGAGSSTGTSMGEQYRQKLRRQKRYTFISDTFTADKEKAMDVTLRKPDESSLHN